MGTHGSRARRRLPESSPDEVMVWEYDGSGKTGTWRTYDDMKKLLRKRRKKQKIKKGTTTEHLPKKEVILKNAKKAQPGHEFTVPNSAGKRLYAFKVGEAAPKKSSARSTQTENDTHVESADSAF